MNNSSFFWAIIIIALVAAIGVVSFWGDISKWYSGVTDEGVFAPKMQNFVLMDPMWDGFLQIVSLPPVHQRL